MIIMNIPASVYLDLLELYCQKKFYTILFMDKNYSNGHLFSGFFKNSVYCFDNVFLHLLVSKIFDTSLMSLFK